MSGCGGGVQARICQHGPRCIAGSQRGWAGWTEAAGQAEGRGRGMDLSAHISGISLTCGGRAGSRGSDRVLRPDQRRLLALRFPYGGLDSSELTLFIEGANPVRQQLVLARCSCNRFGIASRRPTCVGQSQPHQPQGPRPREGQAARQPRYRASLASPLGLWKMLNRSLFTSTFPAVVSG